MDKDINAYQYSLVLSGVFGRNRKKKFEMFKLARMTENNLIIQNIMVTKGKEMLASLKAKPGCTWRVQCQPLTVRSEGGYEVVSFLCFTHYNVDAGVV